MGMVCPKCETILRHGDLVRVSVLAEFEREGLELHRLHVYAEEWVEHKDCRSRQWFKRVLERIRR